jgi:vitamin B12 transporter
MIIRKGFYRNLKETKYVRLGGFVSLALMLAFAPAALGADDRTVTPPPETVVSASRVAVPAREVGSAVTVIDAETLKDRGVRLVSDVLRDVPGLAVSRSGPAGGFTQVRIRGAEGNQTLVLIDGIEVNNPSLGSDFDFRNLLAAEIARIEILRGPQSALYGSDAIGGVINIITRRPKNGFAATARGEVGTLATREGLAYAGYGGKRFFAAGTVSRLKTEGISVADSDNGNGEADAHENGTARFKAGIRPFDNFEIEGVFMHVDSDTETDDSVAVVNIVDGGGSTATMQDYGRIKGKLTLFGGAWEHIASASFANDQNDFRDDTGATTFISDGGKNKIDYQTNLRFSTPGSAAAEHTVTLAAERERESQDTRSGFSGPDSREIVNYGYVGEYRVSLWDKLFLSGSLRFDDNDELFTDKVTWRTTAAYVHAPWATRFHASAGRGVKNPTLFELFGSTPSFTGNPGLAPEESLGFDIGAEKGFLGGKLTLDATYFENRIKNLIQGAGPMATNFAGTSHIRGIELTAAAEPVERLRFDAFYTYTDAEDPTGTQLIRRARHIAGANARYRFQIMNHPATVNLGVRHNGDQGDQVFDSFFPLTPRNVKLSGFTLVNLAFRLRIRDGVEVFLRGENLLNQDYQEVFGFGAPGATVFGGIHVNFGKGT